MVFQDDIDALFPGLYHCICYFRPERSQPARTQNEFRSVTDKYHYKERVLPVIFSRAKKEKYCIPDAIFKRDECSKLATFFSSFCLCELTGQFTCPSLCPLLSYWVHAHKHTCNTRLKLLLPLRMQLKVFNLCQTLNTYVTRVQATE